MKRLVFVLTAAITLGGCVSQADWARGNTVGHVGCSKNEIRVTDIEANGYTGASSWTAWCGGQAYYCQNKQEGALVDTGERGTSCTPRQPTAGGTAPPPPPAARPPAPAGCTRDTDCKGDRICVQGACVSPPQAATPPPAGAE